MLSVNRCDYPRDLTRLQNQMQEPPPLPARIAVSQCQLSLYSPAVVLLFRACGGSGIDCGASFAVVGLGLVVVVVGVRKT